MGIGGRYQGEPQSEEFALIQAYTGRTHFKKNDWYRCRGPYWVIDYLNSGRQRQRIERGASFMRPSGIAAIYSPNTLYEECRQRQTFLDESYTSGTGGKSEKMAR